MTLSTKEINKIRLLRKSGLKYIEIVKLTRHGKATVVKYSKDIKVRIVPKRKKTAKIVKRMTIEKARIIAHLQADGYVGEKQIKYCNTEINLVREFKNDFRKIFNLECGKIYWDGTAWVTSSGIKDVIDYLKNFKFNSKKWSVPKEIFSSSIPVKTAYLRAMFDDDGSISYSGKWWRIKLHSQNKAGLLQVRKLLESLNINSFIHGPFQPRNKYELEITRKISLVRFIKTIGFSHPAKSNKTKQLLATVKINKSSIPNGSIISSLSRSRREVRKGLLRRKRMEGLVQE